MAEPVFLANSLLLDVEAPSDRAARPWPEEPAHPGARLWYFDCSESCHREIRSCHRIYAAHRGETAKKVLILHTRFGLRSRLREICDLFAEVFCFAELWGREHEYQELLERFDDEHLSLLPVGPGDLHRLRVRERCGPSPSPRVFLSLGRCSDLRLAAAVVAANPDLHFISPHRTGVGAEPNAGPDDFRFRAPNLTIFDAHQGGDSYARHYDLCDTVFIPVERDHCMRGGVRFADACYARKSIVMTRNSQCEALMAQDGRTCTLTESDAEDAGAAIQRARSPDLAIDPPLIERIRQRMPLGAKVDYLIRYVRDGSRTERLATHLHFKARRA